MAENKAVQRNDMSARAKGIYCYLCSLPVDWKLSKTELFTHFTEGRTALETAFKELETLGYISKKRSKNNTNQFNGWTYTVHPHCDLICG